VILAGFSFLLYGQTLVSLREAIDEQALDAHVRKVLFNHATDAIQSKILMIDGVVLLFVVVFAYILTAVTLRPICEARKREQRFLADAAHELRMPLSVMKTGVEILLRGNNDLSVRVKKILTENVEEIDSLTYIANSLLTLVDEKNKTTQIYPPIFIYDTVFNAIKKVTPLADLCQITLTIDAEESAGTLRVSADQLSLSRAFENVIENAIKYTKSGGKVRVSIEYKKPNITVRVCDTGIGISPADLPHVTEAFFRADTARTAHEGSGLGLSIVSEIVQAHNGKLIIESELGKGTKVLVTLPEAAIALPSLS
jgi:two-component system, OmpR family, sensor histidine kinase CiaH